MVCEFEDTNKSNKKFHMGHVLVNTGIYKPVSFQQKPSSNALGQTNSLMLVRKLSIYPKLTYTQS